MKSPHTILVLGAGRIGKTIAFLTQKLIFEAYATVPSVVIADTSEHAMNDPLLDTIEKHVMGKSELLYDLADKYKPDLIVNALPHGMNAMAQDTAIRNGISYLDLTEDVNDTARLTSRAKHEGKPGMVLMPQQGLAPGIINIIGSWLVKQHEARMKEHFPFMRELRLRVGALPQVGYGKLGYATTWSVDGLVNEYMNDAIEVVDRKTEKFPGLSGYEKLRIKGVELEAFRTSGGSGILPMILQNKVPNINYKTLRWPGHHESMMLLLEDFNIKDRELLKQIFRKVPGRTIDCVYLLASLEVEHRSGINETYELGRRFTGLTVDTHRFDAIQATTALGAIGMIELFWANTFRDGVVLPTDVDWPTFERTQAGKLLNVATDVYLNGL